jgi:2-polyprenyl-3-methyl-5-hydroxy-6-metoxy-1,4-benzoquinol methylase
MLMYGWMKFVELAPERYDWAVSLMTLGRLDKLKDSIASRISAGDKVLDIGCGTGTLAVRILRRSASVTGLDMSQYMLDVARKHADREGLGAKLSLIKDSVTQLCKYAHPGSFDCIVCTMVLGELSSDYIKYVFDECLILLRPGGHLIIGDEVWPESSIMRVVYRAILVLSWIPQFLLLRRVNYPVSNLRQLIKDSGFTINHVEKYLMTSFSLIVATKPENPQADHPSAPNSEQLEVVK